MTQLRIALAQCRQTASWTENERAIFEFLENAGRAKAQVVCFPETQTVGYRVDIATPETSVEPERLDALHDKLARRCGELGIACVLGTETPLESNPRGGRPYNSALVTRAAENTIWFASCNMAHAQHQNCRSMVVAPDGQVHGQAELKREELVVTDLDIDLATQAMFKFDTEGCARMLFADTVAPHEYAAAMDGTR